MTPLVGVVMGSASDWPTMSQGGRGARALRASPTRRRVVSAHRMPDEMFAYAETAVAAGCGRSSPAPAARPTCPGMLAAKTTVPVLGVPVASRHLSGQDSLLLDRADAGRRPGGDVRDRRGRGHQRRAVRGRAARRRRRRRSRPRSTPTATERREQAARSMLPPPWPRDGRSSPPATIGMLGGGQLGRYALMAARRMGYGTVVLEPDPQAPAASVADEHLVAAVRRRGRPRPSGDDVRGRHDRVREPAGDRARAPGPRPMSAPSAGSGGDRPGPHRREAVPRRRRDPDRAVRSWSRQPTRSAAVGYPGDPQDGAPRVRRQGPDAPSTDGRATAADAWRFARRVPCVLERGVVARRRGQRDRRPYRRRAHGHLPGRRERSRRRHPRPHGRAGPRRRAGRRTGDRAGARASPMPSTTSGCWPSRCSSSTASCSSTSWRRARTTAGTGRSTPLAPASSSSRSERCAGSGSATRR